MIMIRKRLLLVFTGISLFLIFLWFWNNCFSSPAEGESSSRLRSSSRETISYHNGQMHVYNTDSPFIFIGGFPRSGTTLMRAMLDAHDEVRCGEETRVIPRILQLATQWNKSAKESNRLREAGLTDDILGSAVSAFVLEVIVKHGEAAPRLCNKDPFTLKYGVYLLNLFPKSKFIFMIRDGRAVVHSLITRKVTVTGFDLTSYRQCLTKWSNSMKTMMGQCDELGPSKCLKVKYEDLVLDPKKQMERILDYLGLPWEENVLHHEDFVGKPGGISLSKVERSSDQVVNPINKQAISKWVGSIPQDVIDDMENVAPMLKLLGYL